MTAVLPALVAAAVFVAVLALTRRSASADPGRRVAAYLALRPVSPSGPDHDVPTRRLGRLRAAGDAGLARVPGWSAFERLVDRAGIRRPPAAIAQALLAGAVALAGLLLAAGLSPLALLLVLVAGLAGVRLGLVVRIHRRRRAFEAQLPELLGDLGAALRAGHSFNQALQGVAADAADPAREELGRALNDARLGRPLEDALDDMSERLDSRELDFVLEAITVQRQVGGSLAGIFAIVGETVRERQQFALRVRAITATGRMSALVLLVTPLGFALLLSARNPTYLAPLVRSTGALEATSVCCALFVAGALWLRSIVSTKDMLR